MPRDWPLAGLGADSRRAFTSMEHADHRIIRAEPALWRLVRSIRLQALADAPDAFGSTLADEQQFTSQQWHDRQASGATFLATYNSVALLDSDQLIGIVVGAEYEGEPEAAGLFSMWVAPTSRNGGVGTSLVEAVLHWSAEQGYARVVLDVGDDNAAAIQLYRSCGFLPTGKGSTLAPPRDHVKEHQMERKLGSLPCPRNDAAPNQNET